MWAWASQPAVLLPRDMPFAPAIPRPRPTAQQLPCVPQAGQQHSAHGPAGSGAGGCNLARPQTWVGETPVPRQFILARVGWCRHPAPGRRGYGCGSSIDIEVRAFQVGRERVACRWPSCHARAGCRVRPACRDYRADSRAQKCGAGCAPTAARFRRARRTRPLNNSLDRADRRRITPNPSRALVNITRLAGSGTCDTGVWGANSNACTKPKTCVEPKPLVTMLAKHI
jgi:hypothetical protein